MGDIEIINQKNMSLGVSESKCNNECIAYFIPSELSPAAIPGMIGRQNLGTIS